MNNASTWSGERLETFVFNSTTVEHLHRYAIASGYIKNMIVLDIASGEGYGSNLLAKYAAKVIGVDLDKITIETAKTKYQAANLEYRVGSADSIPVESNSIDVVISFETIEHHDKHHEMMKEIKRVLVPNGILIMSSPDKKHYSDERNYKNPFHVKELYLNELKELIGKYFINTRFSFQNIFNGSLVIPEQQIIGFDFFNGDFDVVELRQGVVPMYILAFASDSNIEYENNASCFDGENIFAHHQENLYEALRKKVRDETALWIKSSWSYKIGNAILKPLKFFKK